MYNILSVLMRIFIFTKLVVTCGNYFEMFIKRCFNKLVSSNFLELSGKSFEAHYE